MDVNITPQNKTILWTIKQAIVAPRLTVNTHQGWPYAPYQELMVTLPFAARAAVFFLSLTTLTLLVCGIQVRLWRLTLLAGLFMLPALVLMSGGIPHLAGLTPSQFAGYQAKMMPVLTSLSLILALFVLRNLPRLPLGLVLLLLALAAGGYPLVGLLDEPKRKALETFIQAGMIAYVFFLTLFVRLRRTQKVEI